MPKFYPGILSKIPDIFFKQNLIDIVPWGISLDGFTITQPTNWEVSPNGHGLYLYANAAALQNTQGGIYSKLIFGPILQASKQTSVEWYIINKAGTDTHEFYLFFSNAQELTPGATSHLFGFKVLNNAIYGINNNGTAVTATNLSATIAAGDRLRVEVNQGVNVKFYVNDVLKATVTTTLPGAGQYYSAVSLKDTQATPTGLYFVVGRALILRQN